MPDGQTLVVGLGGIRTHAWLRSGETRSMDGVAPAPAAGGPACAARSLSDVPQAIIRLGCRRRRRRP
ncbi:hypothetical protein [Halomonas sp.]|uniref:hypothetical protein n=1 Tax=Halomonas sp. TaxID=1486246 RepID=UPI003A0FC0BD